MTRPGVSRRVQSVRRHHACASRRWLRTSPQVPGFFRFEPLELNPAPYVPRLRGICAPARAPLRNARQYPPPACQSRRTMTGQCRKIPPAPLPPRPAADSVDSLPHSRAQHGQMTAPAPPGERCESSAATIYSDLSSFVASAARRQPPNLKHSRTRASHSSTRARRSCSGPEHFCRARCGRRRAVGERPLRKRGLTRPAGDAVRARATQRRGEHSSSRSVCGPPQLSCGIRACKGHVLRRHGKLAPDVARFRT